MTTRGIEALRAAHVDHEVLRYRFARKGARSAAEALQIPADEVVKSIVFRCADGTFVFALIDGKGSVSTRQLGRVTGHRHIEAASPRDAERITGYQVGGISPLGARRCLPVVLDAQTAARRSLIVNAGARGTLVRVSTQDLIEVTSAIVAPIRAN